LASQRSVSAEPRLAPAARGSFQSEHRRERHILMPLERKLGSPRPGIWGVGFMMMTRGGTPISCSVTRDALNNLFEGKGGIAAVGQLAVFEQCRDQIEAIASQKWDCSKREDGRVNVKSEDLVKAGLF
jgi:hypothetical protein